MRIQTVREMTKGYTVGVCSRFQFNLTIEMFVDKRCRNDSCIHKPMKVKVYRLLIHILVINQKLNVIPEII